MNLSIFLISKFLNSSLSVLSFLISEFNFFSIKVNVLDTKFPNSFASSLFNLVFNYSSEKSPSWPKGISLA